KFLSLAQIQVSEIGPADAYRVRQHRLEDCLKLSGRVRDNAQYLRGRCLLLQRLDKLLPSLGEFAPAFFELVFQIGGLSLHSITSSARARKDSGIVRPIAFAGLTLATSSNLVA